MTFFRHFIERDDFTTLVATNSPLIKEYELPYSPVKTSPPRIWLRLSRTRFYPIVSGLEKLKGGVLLSKELIQAAIEFKPDAVFTVAGSWDWTALAAQRLARRLRVPLIASFNDWFDYGAFPPYEIFRKPVERRFRKFYLEADLALCTCDGMKEALGPHPNVHVLYPSGAKMPVDESGYTPLPQEGGVPFTVFFGGSLGDWYGPMMESLVQATSQAGFENIQFRIFGSLQTWSRQFDEYARKKGIFGGQVPFEELRRHAEAADLLILPMGFGEACAQVERTSFKTKFLDYLSFRRPILVWGPEYSSAVRVAREFDSAECVTVNDSDSCAEVINRLAKDQHRRQQLIHNARTMYEDRFHPDKIHEGLVRRIQETIQNFQSDG